MTYTANRSFVSDMEVLGKYFQAYLLLCIAACRLIVFFKVCMKWKVYKLLNYTPEKKF